MKVLAYYPLHYGAEYLAYSIQSIRDHVDKIIILYSAKPSYGHNAHLECPESEQLLKDIAYGASDKIEWHHVDASFEGQHRNQIWRHALNHDLVLAADADEIFGADLPHALERAHTGEFKEYGIDGFINFWKDFSHVCIDGYRPVRIISTHSRQGRGEMKLTVYHFGYCISEKMMRYKWAIHGHASELRENWIDEVYLSDRKNDLHPVARELWNTQDFDKNMLPEFLKSHPYFNL